MGPPAGDIMVPMIQAILSAILLFFSSLLSLAGSSDLPGSSGIAEAGSSQRNIVTSVPSGLVTVNAQQMEFVENSEWKSAEQPESFYVNFRDIAGFHFESNEAGQIDITWDLISDHVCFGPQSDGAIMKLLASPVMVKVDPAASVTPQRIYLVNGDQAITLIR